MTTLQIGKAVHAILSNDSNVSALVGNKIFPVVCKEGTTYPFVVYQRIGITPYITKDGVAGEMCNVSVIIAAASYSESVIIAEAVRGALEGNTISFNGGLNVTGIDLGTADEDFIDDVFVQNLNFNIHSRR